MCATLDDLFNCSKQTILCRLNIRLIFLFLHSFLLINISGLSVYIHFVYDISHWSVLQSKLGALFRPVLPLTHILEVEPPFPSLKQPLPSQPEPVAKPATLPSTAIATAATTIATSVNRDTMWVTAIHSRIIICPQHGCFCFTDNLFASLATFF